MASYPVHPSVPLAGPTTEMTSSPPAGHAFIPQALAHPLPHPQSLPHQPLYPHNHPMVPLQHPHSIHHPQHPQQQQQQYHHPQQHPQSFHPYQRTTFAHPHVHTALQPPQHSTVPIHPTSGVATEKREKGTLSKVTLPSATMPLTFTPSSPHWQGLVASGAMPVRQALQSFIASSGDRPPSTKEEAQAALEEMFRRRAEKVRQAIEQGQLTTTEALRHRVNQRRESVILQEGGLAQQSTMQRMDHPDPAADGHTTGILDATNSHPQFNQDPPLLQDEPMSFLGEHACTWGLSDDDLMSSFTTFTARLGDSFLSPSCTSGPAPTSATTTLPSLPMSIQTEVGPRGHAGLPILSPSMDQSPTSSASASPSPWMPWMTLHAKDPHVEQAKDAFISVAESFKPESLSSAQQAPFKQGGPLYSPMPDGIGQLGDKQQHQIQAWNQYMHYILLQQGQDPAVCPPHPQHVHPHGPLPTLQVPLSKPQPDPVLGTLFNPISAGTDPWQGPGQGLSPPGWNQEPGSGSLANPQTRLGGGTGIVHPHWQATMMTMMMDTNPSLESLDGLGRGLWTTPFVDPNVDQGQN